MSRDDAAWLRDIIDAIDAIKSYVAVRSLDEPVVFDAVCMRIIQIGEAARALDASMRARSPEIPWRDIAGMRNHLAHRYFATSRSLVEETIECELPPLREAVEKLAGLPDGSLATEQD